MSERLYEAYPFFSNAIPEESIVHRYARETAIHWACRGGNEGCINDTFAQVRLIGQTGRSTVRGLEKVIYCNGLRGVGRQSEWVLMWQKMQQSTDIDERALIINTLGCSDDREVLRDFLQNSIATNSDNNYARSERLQVFNSVLESSVGITAAVEFLEMYEQEGIAQL